MSIQQTNLRKHNLYATWANMKQRCSNKDNPTYPYYGGRGIKVCDRWLNSFSNFLEDMGEKPSPSHSLDRVDNNKGYSPDNCIWSNLSEQRINRRMFKNSTSGYRGVSFHIRDKKWHARISQNNKLIFLGSYENIEDAVIARKKAEQEYWSKSWNPKK